MSTFSLLTRLPPHLKCTKINKLWAEKTPFGDGNCVIRILAKPSRQRVCITILVLSRWLHILKKNRMVKKLPNWGKKLLQNIPGVLELPSPWLLGCGLLLPGRLLTDGGSPSSFQSEKKSFRWAFWSWAPCRGIPTSNHPNTHDVFPGFRWDPNGKRHLQFLQLGFAAGTSPQSVLKDPESNRHFSTSWVGNS